MVSAHFGMFFFTGASTLSFIACSCLGRGLKKRRKVWPLSILASSPPSVTQVRCFSYWGTSIGAAGFNPELLAISSMSEVRSEHKVCFEASLIHTRGCWAAKQSPKECDLQWPPPRPHPPTPPPLVRKWSHFPPSIFTLPNTDLVNHFNDIFLKYKFMSSARSTLYKLLDKRSARQCYCLLADLVYPGVFYKQLCNSSIHCSYIKWSFYSESLRHCLSQTIRAGELTFWEKVYPHHVSHVMCHVSGVKSHIYIFCCSSFFIKWWS